MLEIFTVSEGLFNKKVDFFKLKINQKSLFINFFIASFMNTFVPDSNYYNSYFNSLEIKSRFLSP